MSLDRTQKRKQDNKMMLIFAAIVYIFVLFFSLHVGTAMTIAPSITFIEAIGQGLTHMENSPFTFIFSGSTLTAIAVISFFYIALVAWVHYSGIVAGNDTEKKPGGSAKWNDDWDKYNKFVVFIPIIIPLSTTTRFLFCVITSHNTAVMYPSNQSNIEK